MSDSFVTPLIVILEAPLSMGFPTQECCCRLPLPFPGNLPNPGIKPTIYNPEGGGEPYLYPTYDRKSFWAQLGKKRISQVF
jgi:hypothetical protein